MKEYERLTEKGVPCSVASRAFNGKHEQYYYRLAELEDKIENGTLIELPCKVGDTVWYIQSYHCSNEYTVEKMVVNGFSIRPYGAVCVIGKFEEEAYYIYKTKAAAKAKLKELRGGGNG